MTASSKNKFNWIAVIMLFAALIAKDVYEYFKKEVKRPYETHQIVIDNSRQIEILQKDIEKILIETNKELERIDSVNSRQWRVISTKRDKK